MTHHKTHRLSLVDTFPFSVPHGHLFLLFWCGRSPTLSLSADSEAVFGIKHQSLNKTARTSRGSFFIGGKIHLITDFNHPLLRRIAIDLEKGFKVFMSK